MPKGNYRKRLAKQRMAKKKCEREVKESYLFGCQHCEQNIFYWCQLFRTFAELPFGNQADTFGLSCFCCRLVFSFFPSFVSSCYCASISWRFHFLFQIEKLWGPEETVNSHHSTWEHKQISWLWPENKPVPKKFRGEIHELHLSELLKTDWTREKVISQHPLPRGFLLIFFWF